MATGGVLCPYCFCHETVWHQDTCPAIRTLPLQKRIDINIMKLEERIEYIYSKAKFVSAYGSQIPGIKENIENYNKIKEMLW